MSSHKTVTYCADVAYNFEDFYQNQYFADCTIFIPDQPPMRVSRAVLSNFSSFFKSGFTSEMEESKTNEVQIKFNPCNMLPAVIHYMHTECIDVTPENIMPLIETSLYYGVDSLSEGLLAKLDEEVTPENVLYFVQSCYDNSLQRSLNVISKHVSRLYDSINREDIRNNFDIEVFCTILTDAVQVYGFRGNLKNEILQFMKDAPVETQEQADALNSLAHLGKGIPSNWTVGNK